MNRKLKKVIFPFIFFLISVVFFKLYTDSLQDFPLELIQNISESKESYFISPLILDFDREAPQPLLDIKRPIETIGYLREIIREGNFGKNIDQSWKFLTVKRITILAKYVKADILGSYKDLQQLREWHAAARPADWEFWKHRELETWEANLAEYYSLVGREINYVVAESKSETEKIEKLVKVGGTIKFHQRDLEWVVTTWPMEDSDRVYLKKICDDIFAALWERIKSVVPSHHPNEYIYSVQGATSDQNYGLYNLWFETGWFDGEKAALSVEIWNGLSFEEKKLFVEDRYGLTLGRLALTEGTKELAVRIQLPLEAQIDEIPRILLKRVAYLSGGTPSIQSERISKSSLWILTSNLSLEQEKQLLKLKKIGWQLKQKKLLGEKSYEYLFIDWSGRIYFAGFTIFLLLFLYSGLVLIDRVKPQPNLINLKKGREVFKKIFLLPRCFLKIIFKINRRNSFVLVSVYLIGAFLGGRNWDFLAIWTFFFWTAIALVWKIDNRVSFLVALILMFSCPVLVILKKESGVENLAIFSYFFILTGTIQKVYEERRDVIPKAVRQGLGQDILVCFFQTMITFLVMIVVLWLIKETFFYRYFFGTTFVKEMLSRVLVKMIMMWIALGILLKIISLFLFKKIFRKKVAINLFLKENAVLGKLIFLLVLFSLVLVLNRRLFAYSRAFFERHPHIFSVFPDNGSPGTKVTVAGHNFREKGVVYLNGIVQVVNEWREEKIVFEITDEYSDTGLIKVKSEYNSKPLESNGVKFTFIDTSPPAEKEMEIY